MSFAGMMAAAQPTKLVSTVKKPASKPAHPLSESTSISTQPRKTQPTRTDSSVSQEKKEKKHGFGFFGGGKKKPTKDTETSRSISPSPSPYEVLPWEDPEAPQPPNLRAPAAFPNQIAPSANLQAIRNGSVDLSNHGSSQRSSQHSSQHSSARSSEVPSTISVEPQPEPKRSQPVNRPAELILEGKTNLRPDDLVHVQNRRRPVEDEARAPQAHILQAPVLKEIRMHSPKTGSMPIPPGVVSRAPTIPQRASNRPSTQMDRTELPQTTSTRGDAEWDEVQRQQYERQRQQREHQRLPSIPQAPQLQVQLPPPQRYLSIDFVPSPKSFKSFDRKDFSPPVHSEILESYFPIEESIHNGSGQDQIQQTLGQNGDWWKEYSPPQELFYIPETIPDGLLAFFDDDELDAEVDRIRNPPRIPTPAELIPPEMKENRMRQNNQTPYDRHSGNSATSPGASSTAFSRGSIATSYTTASLYDSASDYGAPGDGNSRWSMSSNEDFPMRKVRSRNLDGSARSNTMQAKAAPGKKSGELTCVVCKEDFKKRKTVTLDCQHIYCQRCMRDHILTAMERESTFPPKCCAIKVSPKVIGAVCTVADRAALHQKTLEFKVTVDRRIYCPNSKCGRFIPLFPSNKAENAFCTRCEISICQECKGHAHPTGVSCPGSDSLDEFPGPGESINAGWRRCFECRAIVKRSTDVESHLACRCGAEFCFVCGLVWRTCTCCGDEDQITRQQAMQKQRIVELNDDYKEEGEEAPAAAPTTTTTTNTQEQSRPASSPKTWLFDEPEDFIDEKPAPKTSSSANTERMIVDIPKRVDSLTAKYDELREALETIMEEQESRMNDRLVGVRTQISAGRFERDAKHQQAVTEKKDTLDSRTSEKSTKLEEEHHTAISDLQTKHEDEEDDVWLGLRTRLRDTPGPQRAIREKNVIDKLKARQIEELEALKLQFSTEVNSIRTVVEGEMKKEVAEMNKKRDEERIVEDAEQRESSRKEIAEGKWMEAVRRSRKDRMALMFLAEKDEEKIQQLENELAESFINVRAAPPIPQGRPRKDSHASQISTISYTSSSMKSYRTAQRAR